MRLFRKLGLALVGIALLHGTVAAETADPAAPQIEFTWFFEVIFRAVQRDPRPLKQPFFLNPAEERRLDAVLTDWQKASAGITAYSCRYTRWDYDPTFGPKANDFLMSERHGELKFRAPDQGLAKDLDVKQYDIATGKFIENRGSLKHVAYNGEFFYQMNASMKTLDVYEVPARRDGQNLMQDLRDLLLGVEATRLKVRFWIREITPPEHQGRQVWLEVWPKHYPGPFSLVCQRCEIILYLPEYRVIAAQFHAPGGQDRAAWLFEEQRFNEAAEVADSDFRPPTPAGWRRMYYPLIPMPPAQHPQPLAPAAPAAAPAVAAPPCPSPKAVSGGKNRSRVKRRGLLRSRPGFPRFRFRGRLVCRNCCALPVSRACR